jgi:DNA-binding winged helix-turn-helix (wHTH) protein
MSRQAKHLLEFGPFRMDLEERLLMRDQETIPLSPKAFETLLVLVQHSERVVLKDDLMKTLWPDTFVEESNLSQHIFLLRKALGEKAHEPQYIVTVPGRGYRFAQKVVDLSEANGELVVQSSSIQRVTIEGAYPAGRSWVPPTAAIFAAAVLLSGGLYWYLHSSAPLTARDTIVLGDFADPTGDVVFDGTLRQGLSVELEQSPFLSLVLEEQIHQTLRMMSQKSNVQLTPEITREVCQRTNAAAALNGSIAMIGTRYNLIVRAVDCGNGGLIASVEAQASDKSHVLDALGKLASDMRRKLGESLSTLQKYNTPIEQATTPSLEALQALSFGLRAQETTGDFAGSLIFFQRAAELDPNFALAYFDLGDSYASVGETVLGAEYMRKAFELRAGASERERLIIEGEYYYYVTGDLRKTRQSYEFIARTYPRYIYSPLWLGLVSNALGQYEEGLKRHLETLRLAPYNALPYRYVALTYLSLNRVEDAAAIARDAHRKGLDSNFGSVLYGMAFYRNDSAEMARQAAGARGKAGDEDLLFALEADTAAYFGHLAKARELSRRAVDSAERAGEKETGAGYMAVSALREALFGDTAKALQQATAAKGRSNGRDTDYAAALALAYAGDSNRAQASADDLGVRFPEDTVVQINYLPTLRAKIAVSRSKTQQALDTLRDAAPYELGMPVYSLYNWPNLYPVYVRGEAYLAAHQGREAAAEFQNILDHRGIVLNEPIGALAHLQLGRAYAMQGDTTKARVAYQDFLTLWKDAGPEIPILRQAKAEYKKLSAPLPPSR